LVEAVERLEQPRRRPDALTALARDLDCGGDVVRLEQRAAERLELAELVLPVTAGGPARGRVAEAALPAPEGVRADAEQLGRRVGSNPAHCGSPVRQVPALPLAFGRGSPSQAAQTLSGRRGVLTASYVSAQDLNAILHSVRST